MLYQLTPDLPSIQIWLVVQVLGVLANILIYFWLAGLASLIPLLCQSQFPFGVIIYTD